MQRVYCHACNDYEFLDACLAMKRYFKSIQKETKTEGKIDTEKEIRSNDQVESASRVRKTAPSEQIKEFQKRFKLKTGQKDTEIEENSDFTDERKDSVIVSKAKKLACPEKIKEFQKRFKLSSKRTEPIAPDINGDSPTSEVLGDDPLPFANRPDPCTFMSWNANSFLIRVKNDREEICAFLNQHRPDVIAIQEVRIPSAGLKGEPRNHNAMKDDTPSSREDKQVIQNAFSLPPLNEYKAWWSLSDTKYGGTALLVKKKFTPLKISYSLNDGQRQSESAGFKQRAVHEADGRAIFAEFSTFSLLNTYVPNNGWREETFKRRRKWDKRMVEFVVQQKNRKPLIWCGDLNVSHTDMDVSHPEFFRSSRQPGEVPEDPDDTGQPSFTRNEQKRFSTILREGELVDTFRLLHPEKNMDSGFSWCGNPIGKYRGKKMRLDYFLVSKSLVERLVSSEIHGRGVEMDGFLGSDHCPVTMKLKAMDTALVQEE